MNAVKLVNLGLPKSGTTTLSRALSAAGWKTADHKVRRGRAGGSTRAGTFVAEHIYRGYFETGNPLAFLPMFDALTEISALRGPLCLWPQCDYPVLKAMRAAQPDLLFVATWRPTEAISDSVMRWTNLGTKRLPAGNIPGLPRGRGTSETERLRWIEGHYAMLRDLFADDPQFLELDVGAPDARARLAAFSGLDLPWWGRANVNTGNPAATGGAA